MNTKSEWAAFLFLSTYRIMVYFSAWVTVKTVKATDLENSLLRHQH